MWLSFPLLTLLTGVQYNVNSLTLGTHAHNEGYCSYLVCVCVCMYVCVSVRSFLPPRASRPRNVSTYVFTAMWKNFYNHDFR